MDAMKEYRIGFDKISEAPITDMRTRKNLK